MSRQASLADQTTCPPSNSSAASITACGGMDAGLHRDGRCASCYRRSPGCAARCSCVPYGPLRSGRVGPNSATTGTRNAAARCMGPVSPPMKSAARRVSEISSPTEHFTGVATPPLASRTASASASSPGPWLTTTAKPRLASAGATAPYDSAGQHFAPQPAPGFTIANRSAASCASVRSAQASAAGSTGNNGSM